MADLYQFFCICAFLKHTCQKNHIRTVRKRRNRQNLKFFSNCVTTLWQAASCWIDFDFEDVITNLAC